MPTSTADPGSRVAGAGPEPGLTPHGTPPPLRRADPGPGARLGVPPPADRLYGWLVTAGVVLIAALLRFYDLGEPTDRGTPVFDEKHYVPQAWEMVRNGGVENNPGYEKIVHPPLAKQLIALGQLVFGYDGVGWRVSAALAGVLTVLLVVRIGRRLTRSTALGGLAGLLLVADGLSHVQSRMGMLDAFSAVFVVAAFAALLCDRDDVRARMARVIAEGRVGDHPFGPRWGVRWWRLVAGVCLGLACAVKWNGSYYVAAFGVLCVLWDVSLRRRAGVARPWAGTAARDLAPALWALALVPILTYVGSWWAWFGSETGIDRHQVGREIGTGGMWSWMPDAVRSLWYYHGQALAFHENLTTSSAGRHPWESKPWTWPMGLRPMLYRYSDSATGCGESECVSAVMLIGTPALWWPAIPVLLWGLWRAVTRADWRWIAVLVGYGAGFLPWFLNLDRQMYFFYMMPVVPFLVLGVVLVMGRMLGHAGESERRRRTGRLVVAGWLALILVNFVWLWPILVGDPITQAHWQAELWLPSWR
ncbi:dolichyl-phosphate-mannose--protein mannosyltransferase [Pseudonocardia sp. EC080625-04]|uniref:dolichyl-phosphate-mannose--protein mannosyltransferase n=1 Tax=Pseudonocardia sp. EC080625-04 TaxID=1096868 RepID=UPI0006CB5876|nr:phospholipid carrier-dependent glycosyltransferase [Pseudonocardia sp. EC080625-04]ALE75052.1 dolichyl-phosphate-mannose--protein mannosyltransferase [Pseudonocardia sp. EC080625-04]